MHKVYFNTLHCTTKYYKNLSNLNAPRREPQFFAVPFNHLWNSVKSISYIGPKLYNKTANIINKDIKYFTTFKKKILKERLDQNGPREDSIEMLCLPLGCSNPGKGCRGNQSEWWGMVIKLT